MFVQREMTNDLSLISLFIYYSYRKGSSLRAKIVIESPDVVHYNK